jgi:hypothetical protein
MSKGKRVIDPLPLMDELNADACVLPYWLVLPQ